MYRLSVIVIILLLWILLDLMILFKGPVEPLPYRRVRSAFYDLADWVRWVLIAQIFGSTSGLTLGVIFNHWTVIISMILLVLSLLALYSISYLNAGAFYIMTHKKEETTK